VELFPYESQEALLFIIEKSRIFEDEIRRCFDNSRHGRIYGG